MLMYIISSYSQFFVGSNIYQYTLKCNKGDIFLLYVYLQTAEVLLGW
jgi:hypothetical protein